jgi:hypothetical protein
MSVRAVSFVATIITSPLIESFGTEDCPALGAPCCGTLGKPSRVIEAP